MMRLCPSGIAGTDSIANPTAIVLPNKTIVLVYRYSTGVKYGAGEAIATFIADRAEGPWHSVNPDLTSLQVEDPVLYRTKRGLHLAAHQYNATYVLPNGTAINVDYGDPRMASGAHLFSKDGVHWRTSEHAL
jgi:hypothetical protein